MGPSSQLSGGECIRRTLWEDKITSQLKNQLRTVLRHPRDEESKERLQAFHYIFTVVLRSFKRFKSSLPQEKELQTFNKHLFSSQFMSEIVSRSLIFDTQEVFMNTYQICYGQVSISMFPAVGIALLRYELESFLSR
jgi:hypothetical protein